MERTLVRDIKVGKPVLLKGWVHEIRSLSKLKFLLLRDYTGIVQCVVSGDLMNETDGIGDEYVVEIEGRAKKASIKSDIERKDLEIEVESIKIISKSESLPIQVKEKASDANLPTRLDYRFLDTRKREINAIFKVRSSFYRHMSDFFEGNGFTIINTPKLTTIGLESGAESFEVKYFDKKVYLAQSPQFYKQMFVMGGFERVFEIGAVYRAEKSHTTRHLTEFMGADIEMGFIKDENDVMDVLEEMMKYVIQNIKKERESELKKLGVDIKIPKKIPRIPMSELKKVLADKGKKLKEDDDLDSEAEKMIGEYVLKKYGEEFVFVTEYPASVRPFYHMRPDNKKLTRSFDLLWRGVEVTTGAQREHRLDILEKQAKEKGVKIDPIYAAIFKYGAIPHGGAGMGLDRLIQRLLNLENIREALLLTRDPERVKP
ncbi:aspartate--tRNA(Asn) ligase [Candidatus Pacearchaeota archaeon CG_4_9_14_0_2_um_filter_39_13]|nr:aspartate--tRNA(Asn) ligase [Candidatus Pacearchaeota archaeon]OIO43876.1 MAG: aspartate--tRNA(Asn) ligase [Candidatus Pacearchaeota archaeon CG1_02_39_14]PJC44725.1 MAG: aspartate--tRNA(Asn) ligase [Candidatus Pacearchaeota archaeon CG_4_9_14_0_2_um_filter_39_13]